MNNNRTRRPKQQYVGKYKWTLSRVVAHAKKDAVHNKVTKISGAAPGEHNFIPAYQEGLRTVIEQMTEDETNEMIKLAEEWEKEGLPPDVRRRYGLCFRVCSHANDFGNCRNAEKNGKKWIDNIIQHAMKTMGMRLVILSANYNRNGEIAT